MAMRGRSVIKVLTLAWPFAMAVGGCADQKIPFSARLFEAAKQRCHATDAYIMKDYPKTISFHGSSAGHHEQANCLRERLAGTDIRQIIDLGSTMYEPT